MIHKHSHSYRVTYKGRVYETIYILVAELVSKGYSFKYIATEVYEHCKNPYNALENCLNYIYAYHPHLMSGLKRPVKPVQVIPAKSKVTIEVTSDNLNKALKHKLTKAEEKAFTAKFKALSPKQRLKLFKKML